MHKKILLRFFFIFLLSLVLLIFSCTEKGEIKSEAVSAQKKQEPLIQKKIQWYYFSDVGGLQIKRINSISEIPKKEFKPWTESVRVSGIGFMYSPPLLLVNKAGVINLADTEKFSILQFRELQNKTVAGFYKTDCGSVIRLYTNTVFSEIIDTDHFCLYKYNCVNKKIESLISTQNFNLQKEAQLTNLHFNKKWYASFKTESEKKIKFNYYEFDSFSELMKKNYKSISQDEFIKNSNRRFLQKNNITNQLDLKINEKLLSLEHENLKIEFYSDKIKDKIVLFKNTHQNNDEPYKTTAKAIKYTSENDKISAVLIDSGELFYLKNDCEWKKEKLPTLPENFVYTHFFITENEIIAAWEEQYFFNIGRAGLLKKSNKK